MKRPLPVIVLVSGLGLLPTASSPAISCVFLNPLIGQGQEPFIHNGQLTIVYSTDASWTRAYRLGMLVLRGDDPLDPALWEKVGPVFSGTSDETGDSYEPGHNSTPVLSPDGSESWLFYPARTQPGDGWADRAIRQRLDQRRRAAGRGAGSRVIA